MDYLQEHIKFINICGLLFDIAGAFLMFVFTPMHSRKPDLGSGGMDVISKGAEWLYFGKRRQKFEHVLIRLGMGLLIAGFIAQLVAASL